MNKIKAIIFFLSVCLVAFSACVSERSNKGKIIRNSPTEEVIKRGDPYRPNYHFTTKAGWINDPNGMIYDAHTETYHLYYQYSTVKTEADKYWGHATSKDLVSWKDHGIVITPDAHGDIWSGCCVNDINNTTGLFDDSIAPESRIVALFTYHTYSRVIGDSVKLYYSLDAGYTFIEHGIVIDNEDNAYGTEMRDPKVRWLEDGKCWLMAIGGFNGEIRIFTSEDLFSWELNNVTKSFNFSNDANCECVDLFPIKQEESDNIKWVLALSMSKYWVGNLKKDIHGYYSFKALTGRLSLHDDCWPYAGGGRPYGGSTFYGTGDRVVSISWCVDRSAHTVSDKNWNGYQTVVTEHKLYAEGGGYYLSSYPVSELDKAVRETCMLSITDTTYTKNTNIFSDIKRASFDLEMDLDVSELTSFTLYARKGEKEETKFSYLEISNLFIANAKKSGKVLNYTVDTKIKKKSDRMKIRMLFDNSIFEVFIDDGRHWQAGQVLPAIDSTGLFFAFSGSLTINNLSLYSTIGIIDNAKK